MTYTFQCIRPFTPSSKLVSSSNTSYPITHNVNCGKFSLQLRSFLAAMKTNREPNSYAKAMKNARWREVMKIEIETLENNKTWIIEDLPPVKKAIGSK